MNNCTDHDQKGTKDGEVMFPGFRFHPTDEELVEFYLQRKVEKKPISIEIIKQIDIYKHDPWDLPSKYISSNSPFLFFLLLFVFNKLRLISSKILNVNPGQTLAQLKYIARDLYSSFT